MTRAEGYYTALDARALYEHKSAAGAIYRAVLRAEVRDRLSWASWQQVGRGLFEIDGVSEGLMRHFSQRRVEIEERAAELVSAGAGELSRERMQAIAIATRRAKQYGVDGGSWRDEARARSAEHGLGQVELSALQARTPATADEPDAARMFERLSGPLGLTEMHNTFARRHALAELAGEFPQGASIARVEQAASAYLADPSVRQLRDDARDEHRYTTVGLLECELQIVDGAARRGNERVGVLQSDLVDYMLGDREVELNEDQAAAVRSISTSGRGIDAVSALAGSGKTTMIGALAACYRQAGWEVIGAAPTGRAGHQLRDTAGVHAETMHSLLLRLTRTGGFGPRTVLVLDEAGMAPTRLTARLLAHAEQAGVKVVAVGDPGQLGSVQAGGWLTAITAQKHPTLAQAIRQHDASERAALSALRDGDPDSYLAHKHQHITAHESETAAIRQLIDGWNAAQQTHGTAGAAMIARDNWTRELANRAARAQLKRNGVLPADGVIVGGREYARGDRVIARRNDRRHDVDNGTLATVIAVEHQTGAMIVQTDSGEPRALHPDYVADHLQHAYALTAHGAQGATVNWAGVIGRAEEFTREWAYTALSRARHQTTLHLIAEAPERAREREQYAPPAPERTLEQARESLASALRRSETQPLALQQTDPENAPSVYELSTRARPTERTPTPQADDSAARTQRPSTQDGPAAAWQEQTDLPDATPPPPESHHTPAVQNRPIVQPADEQPTAQSPAPRTTRLKGINALRQGRQRRGGPTIGR